jgi:DNA ligase (NAD+)
MNQEQAKELIKSLSEQIRRHERLYYVDAEPEISDREFDLLLKKLEQLEKDFPELVLPTSPTQRIGEIVTSFETIKHRVPMLSIDNSYNIDDLQEWIQRMEKIVGRSVFPIVAELKIDGVSGSFQYKNGRIVLGATRGNGIEGDLVTENFKTIKTLPLKIKTTFDMDLRGEVYTPKSKLEELNKQRLAEGEEPFKNCRNLTAGTVKSLDPSVAASRGLQAMVYGIAQAKELGFKSHFESLKFLKEQGFKLNHAYKLCESLDEIQAFIDQIAQEKDNFDFDIDGIVLKVDSFVLQEELGTTAKAPRWAMAYKYPQQQVQTILKDVTWQVGRSQLTPVAELEPVELGGTTVSRASLHNLDQINEKDIRIGDKVIVEKAGYIIPYIVRACIEERTGNEREIVPPEQCPACGEKVSIQPKDLFDTTTQISCSNPNCIGILSRKIIYFVSQLEIDNIGPQLIDQLIEKKLVTSIEDLFTLNFMQLANLERMGAKSAEKILKNIEKAKKASLAKVIAAIGIPNIGKVAGENIATFFNNDKDKFLTADEETLCKIEKIQVKVATDIINYLTNDTNKTFIKALFEWWEGPAEEETESLSVKQNLTGKSFVLTGEALVSRKILEKLVKLSGGQVKTSVSKKTNYLLIGSQEDENFSSSKKTKANQLNVTIIDENKLFEMVGVTLEDVKRLGTNK